MIRKTVSNFTESYAPGELRSRHAKPTQEDCWYCGNKLGDKTVGYIHWFVNRPGERIGQIHEDETEEQKERRLIAVEPSSILNVIWFCGDKHRAKWMKDMDRAAETDIDVAEIEAIKK